MIARRRLGLRGAILAVPLLLVPVGWSNANGQTAPRDCPADAAVALSGWADPVPDQAHALVLVQCPDHVMRVRTLAALGDAKVLSPATITAIADRVADPTEVVRQEALIATIRNAELMRPALLARMAAFGADSDWAAAALRVIGRGATSEPLPNYKRWKPLFDPLPGLETAPALTDQGAGSFGEMPTPAAPVSLWSSSVSKRALWLSQHCHADNAVNKLPRQGQCRFSVAGMTAYAAVVVSEESLNSKFIMFENAVLLARVHTLRLLSSGASISANAAFSKREKQILNMLSGDPKLATANGNVPGLDGFPHFPWPAPRPVLQQPIPLATLGGRGTTLDEVADALRSRIQATDPDFEIGLFSGPPDGFVLLTRMERIGDDGAPFPAQNRFTIRGNPNAGFWDAIRGLMAERPGHFRVIAFVVTSQIAIDPNRPPLAIPLDRIGEASIRIGEASMLPAAISRVPMGARKIFALVCAFERRPGRPQQPWTDGAPSALVHLRRSGIGARIGL